MPVLAVIGSLNVDLTVTTQRFHQPGETITGSTFCTYPGGKGGNQAVAAARLGACVHMVSALGRTTTARSTSAPCKPKVSMRRRSWRKWVPTGVALIQDNQGENRIVVVPGANAQVNSACVDEDRTLRMPTWRCCSWKSRWIPCCRHKRCTGRASPCGEICPRTAAARQPVPAAIPSRPTVASHLLTARPPTASIR